MVYKRLIHITLISLFRVLGHSDRLESELENFIIYAPIFYKNSGFFYKKDIATIGKIGYLVRTNTSKVVLEIIYRETIITEIIINMADIDTILEKVLEQFFTTVYQHNNKDYLGKLFTSHSDVLRIKIRKENLSYPLLEKIYVILPIKVIGTDGVMQNKEIFYEPEGYVAYQIGAGAMPNLYYEMAQKILAELKKKTSEPS